MERVTGRRLARLGRQFDAAPTAEDAAQAARREEWEAHQARRAALARELSQTMDPAHIARVNEHWARTADAQSDAGGAWLATIVTMMLSWAMSDWWGGRLALPPPVGTFYLEHPGVWPTARCVSCRLSLPWRQQQPGDRWATEASGPRFFEACPDCAGLIGPPRDPRAAMAVDTRRPG
jgi:hypothetical protein